MVSINKLKFFEKKLKLIKLYCAPLLLVIIAAIYILVYQTGGIKFVYSHSMYIPIVTAGFIYGIRGGIFFAFLAGIVLGPFMPIDVATGEMQKTINWLYRTGFFVLIGFLAGFASYSVKTYIKNLKWLSRHDQATSLPNRTALVEDFPVLVKRHDEPNLNLLLVVSLNNTRQIKMAYGYDVIDLAVDQISKRFKDCLDEIKHEYEIYRADAVSMCALITNARSDKVHPLMKKLSIMARKPLDISGIPIHVDFRMGFVSFNDIPSDPALYLQHAESAMNYAHESMKNFVEFDEQQVSSIKENLAILGELIKAISDNQLTLDYQPKIDIRHTNVCAVEALIRWTHPEKGNIPPNVFIPHAENSTLIEPLTSFVVEEAAKQIVRWQNAGVNLPIAINVSPYNLGQRGFAQSVINILKRYNVAPELIEIEVTEGALILDIECCAVELDILDNAGIVISVDDFGTGYSSLQYLQSLPMSKIKIDQSFVKHLPDEAASVHIVEASISLAHNLGMRVVAEGVENQAAYDFLKEKGCDYAQGYMISQPLPEADFLRWYQNFKSNTLTFPPNLGP